MEGPAVSQPQPRAPTNLAFESTSTRRAIVASYWLVIIIALPLWWTTTSIERQSLPTSRVSAQQGRELVFPLNVHIDTSNLSAFDGHVLAQQVEYYMRNSPDMQKSSIQLGVSSDQKHAGLYQVLLSHGDRAPLAEDRHLLYAVSSEASSSTVVAMQLADTLVTLLSPYTSLRSSQAQSVVRYSPRYRLAFTLLNEDAGSQNAALSWDIGDSISKHISPVLDQLALLHNFTIESQVQFHAPLAFEPRMIHHDDQVAYGLTQEDLTVFVNSAEWSLSSSVSNDPVLHFILFVPSSQHSPLRILNNHGHPTSSNAFILPQWGGIILYNPPSVQAARLAAPALDSAFSIFKYQLTTLLGVPALSAHVHSDTSSAQAAGFTNWQLDALLRRRATENTVGAQETLGNMLRLVAQIENMPVGQDVRADVQEALDALDETYTVASMSSALALQFAGKAHSLASRAFFNPGMLALLYFPPEHKYAVYAPLFAAISAPLVAAVIREFLAWKRTREVVKQESEGGTLMRAKVE